MRGTTLPNKKKQNPARRVFHCNLQKGVKYWRREVLIPPCNQISVDHPPRCNRRMLKFLFGRNLWKSAGNAVMASCPSPPPDTKQKWLIVWRFTTPHQAQRQRRQRLGSLLMFNLQEQPFENLWNDLFSHSKNLNQIYTSIREKRRLF